MKQNGNKGFTLIELLVVIAIIGILASVVLASLNSARAKGKDAAVKAQLSSMRAEAELLYDDSSSYANVCAPQSSGPNPYKLYAAAKAQSAVATGPDFCFPSASAWSASAELNATTGVSYCVDSTGFAGVGVASGTVCTTP